MMRKQFAVGLSSLVLFFTGCVEVLSIPNISPSSDGNQIAFLVQANAGQSMALQTLKLNDGSVLRIGDSANIQGAFDWNPSQMALAFVEVAPDQTSSIQLAKLSGDQSSSRLVTLPKNVWVNQLAYSPDGSQIALSVSVLPPGTKPSQVLDSSTDLNGSEARILLLDVATGKLKEIARDKTTDTPSLDWNSSGTRLAYAYDGRVLAYDVVNGKSSEVNWADHLSLRSPSWLNDSTLILIVSPDSPDQDPTQTAIVSFDVTSSQLHAWSVEPNIGAASASPDGKYIAYIQGKPSSDAAARSKGYATTTTTVILLPVDQPSGQAIYAGVSLDRPVWSPDGRTLYVSNANAFSMFAGNRRQIFAIDIASGAATPVFEGPLATSSLLGWSPPQPEATPTP